jgi:hypothetical protein
MLYTFTLPAGMDPLTVTPDRVAAYLTGKGYTVNNGAQIDASGSVTIDLDRDPSADVPAFTDAPTPAETQFAAAKSYLQGTYVPAIQAIPAASRTPEQRAILALCVVLKNALTP